MTLLPELAPATVMVCGVQAPSMGRRPPAPEGALPDAPPPEPVPEPFAREAKHFSEVQPRSLPLSTGWLHNNALPATNLFVYAASWEL